MKNRVTKPGLQAMLRKVSCRHCGKETTIGNIGRHENTCYLNPEIMQLCVVCENPIKNYQTSKGTCSRSCANTHFRTGDQNGNWKNEVYRTTCFHYHKKECIVCGENKIVEVHHNDHNNCNNEPINLIPLCPTHHQYVHSKYRNIVRPVIDAYIKKWKNSV